MKKKPSLILREPVKLYSAGKTDVSEKPEREPSASKKRALKEVGRIEPTVLSERVKAKPEKDLSIDSPVNMTSPSAIKTQMSPRIGQIWDYFCAKASTDGIVTKKFNLTRAEVMKEASIGSTNTYRDALRKFQQLGLIEIELRPGVNSGSIFTLTGKGIAEVQNYLESSRN